MSLYLESKEGVWDLTDGEYVIGRVSDCDIVIKDPRISRQHAVIRVSGKVVSVQDLGSANGVLVNGDRISEPTVLMPNDSLVAGPMLFRLRMSHTGAKHASTTAEMNRDPAVESSDFMPQPDFGKRPESSDLLSGSSGTDFPVDHGTSLPQREPTAARNASSKAALTHRRQRGVVADMDETDIGTDEHYPSDHRRFESKALQRRDWFDGAVEPRQVTESDIIEAERKPPGRWRRLGAGLLDAGLLMFFGSGIPLGLVVAGLVTAQGHAAEVAGPSWAERLLLLGSANGLREALIDIRQWHAENSSAFAIFFAGATLAVLALLLSFLFLQVIPTILKGAPFGHRWLRLELVDTTSRSYLTPGRACLRSLLVIVLAPVILVACLGNRVGPHDRICGSRLVHR